VEAQGGKTIYRKSFTPPAGAIRFDVSSFIVGHPESNITAWELGVIVNNPSLLRKTAFIRNGKQVIWNGTGFVEP
jgi:hypothetical protein